MQGDADNRPQAAGGKRSLPQMSVSHLTPHAVGGVAHGRIIMSIRVVSRATYAGEH